MEITSILTPVYKNIGTTELAYRPSIPEVKIDSHHLQSQLMIPTSVERSINSLLNLPVNVISTTEREGGVSV